jgi:aminobenzoyl-glutamate transport protein
MDHHPPKKSGSRSERILDLIERVGNMLPEPVILFVILTALVIALSVVGSRAGWQVQPLKLEPVLTEKLDASGQAVLNADGQIVMEAVKKPDGTVERKLVPQGEPLTPKSLLTSEGIYWLLSSLLGNFTRSPALGLIFVAMIGIGLAERFGFFSALMRFLAFATPKRLLTPMIVLIGANSSVASDAGYIILPPLAAALYLAVGRHPIAGLAAAFAGVAGGFGGGFFPTGGDGALAGFASTAAHIIDPAYNVGITHNLYFKMGSAVIVMFAGWFVTDKLIEPRLNREAHQAFKDEAHTLENLSLGAKEKKALILSLFTMAFVAIGFAILIFVPGMPLVGTGQQTLANGNILLEGPVAALGSDFAGSLRAVERAGDRWSQVIVPMILCLFLFPGLVYGWFTDQLKGQRDLIEGLYYGTKSIVPVLVIMFFLAQFVESFKYTGLDRMLAYAGGSLLVSVELPVPFLLVLFITVVILGDFAMSGMLSKFGVLAPIFIPMFMMVGISPELTTAAYRVGDSVVNIITPLNSYLLIILAVMHKYKPQAGLGSLISLMLPYSIIFFFVWSAFLVVWYLAGWPLGTDAPIHYAPPMG